jgi:hypothetical protein
MKHFIVSKYRRSVVLASLTASLLMGAISAPAWADESTDAIANTSPGVSTTSGQVQATDCPPLIQTLLAHSKLSGKLASKLKGDGKITCTPGSHLSLTLVRIPNTPKNGQTSSTPIVGQSPSTPQNGQTSSTPIVGQSPSTPQWRESLSRRPGAVQLTPNYAISPYGALYTVQLPTRINVGPYLYYYEAPQILLANPF